MLNKFLKVGELGEYSFILVRYLIVPILEKVCRVVCCLLLVAFATRMRLILFEEGVAGVLPRRSCVAPEEICAESFLT